MIFILSYNLSQTYAIHDRRLVALQPLPAVLYSIGTSSASHPTSITVQWRMYNLDVRTCKTFSLALPACAVQAHRTQRSWLSSRREPRKDGDRPLVQSLPFCKTSRLER
mmetsp:Transcript_12621/g.29025  ORF Transcript_12621/g.29025 Transcript_12621/m.29025 type:complete len:109 (+) Transcript_12621:1467-1793(+)